MKSDFKTYAVNGALGTYALDNSESYSSKIETLFKNYYQKIKSSLDPKEFEKPTTNLEKLIKELYNFKARFIDLKRENIQVLIKFNAAEINKLVLEIRNFLKANNLNELIWPKVKEINGLDGGPGLLKKIYAKGKMKDVGEMYLKEIRPIIEKENIIEAPIDSEAKKTPIEKHNMKPEQ